MSGRLRFPPKHLTASNHHPQGLPTGVFSFTVRAVLTISNENQQLVGNAAIDLQVCSQPTGGSCSISPLNGDNSTFTFFSWGARGTGVPATTLFSLKCWHWAVELSDLPLYYRWILRSKTSSTITSSRWMFLFRGHCWFFFAVFLPWMLSSHPDQSVPLRKSIFLTRRDPVVEIQKVTFVRTRKLLLALKATSEINQGFVSTHLHSQICSHCQQNRSCWLLIFEVTLHMWMSQMQPIVNQIAQYSTARDAAQTISMIASLSRLVTPLPMKFSSTLFFSDHVLDLRHFLLVNGMLSFKICINLFRQWIFQQICSLQLWRFNFCFWFQ